MPGKRIWMALMLAGFSAMSVAQTGGSCQGLVGGAMAQCMQGMGTGSGPGRPGIQSPRPVDTAPAASAGARTDANTTGGVTSRIRSFFSDWSFDLGSSTSGSDADHSLNCNGLVGGAMSQCLQGLEPASGSLAGAGSPQSGRVPAGSRSARSDASSAAGGAARVDRNFTFGGDSLNCQGLVGGAMARCLQGM